MAEIYENELTDILLQEDGNTIKQVEEYLKKALTENNEEKIKELQMVSENFLSQTKELWDNIKKINMMENSYASMIAEASKAEDKDIIREYRKKDREQVKNTIITKANFETFYKEIISYQNKLRKIIYNNEDMEIKVAYAYFNGEFMEVKEIADPTKYLKMEYGSKGKGLVGKLDDTKIKNSITALNSKQDNTNLQQTYYQVHKRGEISRRRIKHKLLILWKLGRRWEGALVNGGFGDLAEVFLEYYYSGTIFNEGDIERNVRKFMVGGEKHDGGVLKVDSLSGMLKGDFTYGLGQQIAAKSLGASLEGYKDLYAFAEELKGINIETSQTKEEIEKIVKRISNKLVYTGKSRNKYVSNRALKTLGLGQELNKMKKEIRVELF